MSTKRLGSKYNFPIQSTLFSGSPACYVPNPTLPIPINPTPLALATSLFPLPRNTQKTGLSLLSRAKSPNFPARCWRASTVVARPPNKGVKKKVLRSLPKLSFDQELKISADCPICLAEFVEGEEIRNQSIDDPPSFSSPPPVYLCGSVGLLLHSLPTVLLRAPASLHSRSSGEPRASTVAYLLFFNLRRAARWRASGDSLVSPHSVKFLAPPLAMLQLRSILSARGPLVRSFSSSGNWGNVFGGNTSDNTPESRDDFERRIFGGVTDNDSNNNSFFEKLDRIERARGKSNSIFGGQLTEHPDEGFDSLEDGLDEKLQKAAEGFYYDEMDDEENYKYRPDVTFRFGEYDIQDLDLEKPAVQKFEPKNMIETTTAEVLEKADFRNVKFLAQFITEAGIIIKRSKTGISAKAQRKLAREIKTARAFGLMPFITMGTKAFLPGKSMKDEDIVLESDNFYEGRVDDLFDREDRDQL